MKNHKLILVISILFITAVAVIPRVYSVRAGQTATTITVSTTADVLDGADGLCSLREAVYVANNNVPFGGVAGECPAGTDADTDIITLADGATYTLSIAGVDEDVTVSGDLDILDNAAALDVQINVANNGSATIDADDIDRVLHIENAAVELNSIALVDGSASPSSFKSGGCIFNDNGILTMNDGEVRLGDAVTGGGIYNYSSTPTGGKVSLNGTHVILNVADTGGGIFSGGDDSALILNGAVVRANTSNSDGGGVLIAGGSLIVEDSTISLNTAQTNGGGIYAADSTVTITDSMIEANEAMGSDTYNGGGGIYLADNLTETNTTIQNSTIKDNNAKFGGGLNGIVEAPQDGRVTIQNSKFTGNQASWGGALYIPGANISDSIFDDNHATSDGGAILIIHLIVTDTVFTNNTAGQDAGAFRAQFFTASNIRVENNEATDLAGGIYLYGTQAKDISNSVIMNNTASYGGGIYISGSDGSRSNISQTSIANNQATEDGGGIYANDSELNISNSTISTNSGNNNGGGLYIETTSTITATNVTIALNTPGQDIYKVGELTLQNSIIYTPDIPNCTLIATPIVSLGNNLTDDASCGGLTQPSDEINVDVGLAPLADNGGNTLTHDLLAGSPAIDSGDAAACAASPVNNVDQRGVPRPIGLSCDKGAVERGSVVFLPAILK